MDTDKTAETAAAERLKPCRAVLSSAQAKALLLIAPKDDVRYYMNGALLDLSSATPAWVATNGHVMIAIKTQVLGPPRSVIVPRALIDFVASAQRGERSCHGEIEVRPGGAITASTAAGASMTGNAIDGRFPDWRRVLPPRKTSGETAQFDTRYLRAFAQARALLCRDKTPKGYLHVEHNGGGPARVGLGPDAIGAIMPLRTDSNEGIEQGWVRS